MRSLRRTLPAALAVSALALVTGACHRSSASSAPRPAAAAPAPVASKPDLRETLRSAADVGTFARGHEAQLHFCFDEFGRRVNPALAGSVTLSVAITEDGDVTDVGVLRRTWAGTGTKEVEACIRDRVLRWKFPQVDDGAGVYPLTFVFTQ
jgi:hypothetical protein